MPKLKNWCILPTYNGTFYVYGNIYEDAFRFTDGTPIHTSTVQNVSSDTEGNFLIQTRNTLYVCNEKDFEEKYSIFNLQQLREAVCQQSAIEFLKILKSEERK